MPQVDYAALADQARKAAPVDYSALAAQARSGSAEPPASLLASRQAASTSAFDANRPPENKIENAGLKTVLDAPLDFGAGLEKTFGIDPMRPIASLPTAAAGIGSGLKNLVLHPLDTAANVSGSLIDAVKRGGQALREQDIPAALQSVGEGYGIAKPAAEVGGTLLNKVKNAIPSTVRAGTNFDKVMGAAKDVPIDTAPANEILARAEELRQRGSTMPKVMRDFAKTQKPAGEIPPDPMTYEAGRDFSSNAGALSARESTSMTPSMKAQIGQFASAMKTANRAAAESVGMGDVYDAAMKEYRQAKSIQEAGQVIKKWALRAAVGTGIGYELLRKQ